MKYTAQKGWFVIHTAEAGWVRSERFGQVCDFEGETPFPQIGVNIHVIQPGQPNCFYHREAGQENFYVLSGKCILIIEEEERELRAGHFVHCPPGTTHVFVGAGDQPCAILMIGYRPEKKRIHYPVSAVAGKYGAAVEKATDSPREAYGQSPVFDQTGTAVWPLE
ncbi:MAG: cupin domain-containing protein [Candidatus Neomarinimicrobiota bacterium]